MNCCIIITTTDKEEIAANIAKILVEKSLAKCVWQDQIKSTYIWEGKLMHDMEYRLMIKSIEANSKEIMDLIKSEHNYSLPGIVQLNIDDGNKDYLDWLGAK